MTLIGKKAIGLLVFIKLLQVTYSVNANRISRIEFFRNYNLTDLIHESNSSSSCNNFPSNSSIEVKSIESYNCWILYQHPNCISIWSYKSDHSILRIKVTITIGSFHMCNEHEGGDQLNLDITKYITYPVTAPEVLERYVDVCTCINVPEYVRRLEKWSLNNHNNEVNAYFQPDCSQSKWKPAELPAGIDADSRDIYSYNQTDNFTGLVYKIKSFGPNFLSPYYQTRCRYSKIMKLETFEGISSFQPHSNQSDIIQMNTEGFISKIGFFSDKFFAGSHLKLDLTTNCSNLPTGLWLTNEVGSVKAKSCVMLYSEQDCKGRSIKLETGNSEVLQENWESTVINPNTLALLYKSFTNWHWETKSFHACNFHEGGPNLNIDITHYFPDKGQSRLAGILETYSNVSSCHNVPRYMSRFDKWSINNHGNGILVYFETNCGSKTFDPIWIPAGRNSFSIGMGSLRRTDNSTGRVHKIKSFGPLKFSTNFDKQMVNIVSSTTEEGMHVSLSKTTNEEIFEVTSETSEEIYKTTFKSPTTITGTSIWVYIGVSIGVLFALMFSALLAVHWVRLNRIQDLLTPEEVQQFLSGYQRKNSNISHKEKCKEEIDAENVAIEKPYDSSIEIAKRNYEIIWSSPLGSGEFGCVYRAYISIPENTDSLEVALKMTKDNCPKNAVLSILSEIKILSYLGQHPNLVCIKGAYTAEISRGVVYVATEICELGSIKDYLKKMANIENKQVDDCSIQTTSLSYSPVDFTQMVRWSYEIASGMEYLDQKHVIHADLAARNVLLTGNRMAKISDFGLSRRLYEYTNYVKQNQEPLPWRWMAVEALKKLEFSSQSDVWSYGVTLWEIFSMGDVPFPGYSWTMDFLSSLESGLRMKRPTHASSDIYKLMTSCWLIEPHDRPTFSQLKQHLARIQGIEGGKEINIPVHSEPNIYK